MARGIGVSSWLRAASAISANKKRKEREKLISSQLNASTSQGPFYSLVSVTFNKQTRAAKIVFEETKKYRKIEKYVTVNYVKHPIYSNNWTTKKKTINKSIKLTNTVLENLNQSEDELIREFAGDIVFVLEDENLFPSWYIIEIAKEKKKQDIFWVNQDIKHKIAVLDKKNEELESEIEKENCNLLPINQSIQACSNHILIFERKIKKATERKTIYFLSIITFGIYSYLKSPKYINSLNKKMENKTKEKENYICQKAEIEKRISTKEATIKKNETSKQELNNELKNKIDEIENEYKAAVDSAKPLVDEINEDESKFIPLKVFCGVKYKKVIGCYVIHNIEKNKYYVGQSKDVYKRILRDHFNGTQVKNIIFAEDYYTSLYENKDDLFEIMIIPCATKDELDAKEKELIEQYNSFNNGYNGTSGNS